MGERGKGEGGRAVSLFAWFETLSVCFSLFVSLSNEKNFPVCFSRRSEYNAYSYVHYWEVYVCMHADVNIVPNCYKYV